MIEDRINHGDTEIRRYGDTERSHGFHGLHGKRKRNTVEIVIPASVSGNPLYGEKTAETQGNEICLNLL